MLTGVQQWQDTASAVADGWDEKYARLYFAPDGIFLRMRLGCFDVWDRGNPFRDENDTAWWKAKYRYQAPFINILGMYLKFDEQRRMSVNPGGEEATWTEDTDISDAIPAAIAHERASVEAIDFPIFMASKCEPPVLIPTSSALAVPVPNPRCDGGPIKPKPIVDKLPNPFAIPWWVWLALGIALSERRRR